MEAECCALAGTHSRPPLLRRRASRPQHTHMALEMRAQCERCGAGLKPEGAAFVCSYECTFCPACAASMAHVCPNCGGELVPRPRRISTGSAV